MLIKTQALMNLKSAQVHPQIAMAVVDLFSDSEKAYNESKNFYGDNFWDDTESENPNETDNTQEITNKVQDELENQNQNK